jgi:hypothetical protein
MMLQTMLRIAGAFGIGLLASACQTVQPVNSPCGVIIDSLRDVYGRTPEMTRRIDQHVERGIAAGCWDRVGKLAR